MNSVVDVAGLNRISRHIYRNAAAAIAGMVKAERPESTGDRPIVAASMFGNTTACINRAREALDLAGWEVLVFHATGSGGRVMQRLAAEGLLSGLMDLTTTELADEVCGGVFTAGLERVHIGGPSGIPVVLSPGCVDMCNFGPIETVPADYRSRLLYEWNANVTLMRTNVDENRRIGALIAETANQCRGPVAVLLPLRGVSMLGAPGQPFCDETADHACFESIRVGLNKEIPVIEVDGNINDLAFADRATQTFLEMSARRTGSASQAGGSKIFL